jgi:hypothetical protein
MGAHRAKGLEMKHMLVGLTVAMTLAAVFPARAQFSPGQPQSPPPRYPQPYSFRLGAPTPEDSYRRGLITRWELEQLEGPLPQALQGPSPNGTKGEAR